MNFKEIQLWVFGLLAFGLSSCIYDNGIYLDEEPEGESPTMSVFLGIDTRNSFQGEDFEDGIGYENYIDIDHDNIAIYFFDSSDNTFIDSFKPAIQSSLADDYVVVDRGIILSGRLLPELGTKFKIVVLANWQTYPVEIDDPADSDAFILVKGITTIEDLTTHAGSRFDALTTPENDAQWLGKGRLMPFYGVCSFDLTQTHRSYLDNDGNVKAGSRIDLTQYPIPLIRALAKVEVVLDNPHLSFDAVEMSRINRAGYAAPYRAGNDWEFDCTDYYSPLYGWQENYMKGVHLVGDDNDAVALPLGFTKINDRIVHEDGSVTMEKWVAYVPEYRNKDAADPASIRVKMKSMGFGESDDSNDDSLIREFYFTSDGLPGDAPDIERNNIYRFKIGVDGALVNIQPFSEHKVRFEFGLQRDDSGDLMVLQIPKRDENDNIVFDEKGDTVMTYPKYFIDFLADDNPNHKVPKEVDADGNILEGGSEIQLEPGDYYAIVVGEDGSMSNAVVWVKDRIGCHVLSNFGSNDNTLHCSARLVEAPFGNNQSEKYYKDIFGFRRIHHFVNHNSIVMHPEQNNMLLRIVTNFGEEDQIIRYYEVESWDEDTLSGWIIRKDAAGNEVGFQEITSAGLLGETVDLNGNPIGN
ncbi:MAG: hypothetical protein K2G85_04250 [Muribaculaceae bacterium]|nr:hypothetical protein [Muribaculaceae bacterium]